MPGEPRWTARPADDGYANGFLVEIVHVVRARQHLSEFADHEYFAVFRDTTDVLDLELADMLVRREYVAISATEAAALKQRIDALWENEILRHHVVRINGTPFAVVGVPRNPDSSVGQIMFDGEGEFVPATC